MTLYAFVAGRIPHIVPGIPVCWTVNAGPHSWLIWMTVVGLIPLTLRLPRPVPHYATFRTVVVYYTPSIYRPVPHTILPCFPVAFSPSSFPYWTLCPRTVGRSLLPPRHRLDLTTTVVTTVRSPLDCYFGHTHLHFATLLRPGGWWLVVTPHYRHATCLLFPGYSCWTLPCSIVHYVPTVLGGRLRFTGRTVLLIRHAHIVPFVVPCCR